MEKEIIRDALDATCEQNVSHNEHEQTAETKPYMYDLLCVVDGKKVRLSYDDGCFRKIYGIFPFKDSPLYLHAIETCYTTRFGANENKIPSIEFWQDLFKIKDDFNKVLGNLGLSILDNCYFATSSHLPSANWVVYFYAKSNELRTDYFGSLKEAKIRYFGTFE